MIKLSSLTKDYYKPKEVCQMLNVGVHTLYNREKQGLIKVDKTVSNRRIYSKETVISCCLKLLYCMKTMDDMMLYMLECQHIDKNNVVTFKDRLMQ